MDRKCLVEYAIEQLTQALEENRLGIALCDSVFHVRFLSYLATIFYFHRLSARRFYLHYSIFPD